MYKFQELFRKSIGDPINYNGQILYLYDRPNFKKGDILRFKILSTNSPHKQIITISVVEPRYKKYLKLNNKKSAGFNLWETTFPKEGAEIEVLNDVQVAICNSWEEIREDGRSRVMQALKNAAMKVKIEENKRIYYCNDKDDDEDFDDLIFEIEIIRAH